MSESDDGAQRELEEFEAVLAAASAALTRQKASAPPPAGAAASGAWGASAWGEAVREMLPPAAKRARTREAAPRAGGRRLNAETGFRGVSFQKRYGNYKADLSFNRDRFNCGLHETAEAAAQAYDAKARELGMEERLLNFPHGKPRTEPLPSFVRNAKTGFFGVREQRTGRAVRYSASVWFKGAYYGRGIFLTKEDAARAYDAKARKLGLPPERLNFPHEHESLPAPIACKNLLPNAHTGLFGVHVQRRFGTESRFIAAVRFRKRNLYCGTHATAEAAARAHDAKARELGVPANRLNFPNESPPAAAAAPATPRWRASTPPPPSIPVDETLAESEFESLLRYFTLELVHTSVGARSRLDLPCYARLGYSAHIAHLLSSGQQPEAARLLRAIREHELGGGGVAAPDSTLFGGMPGAAPVEGQAG